MKVALIGLPQSGKSTLFSAATGIPIDPYAAPQIHMAVVHVPDPRLAFLTQLYNPKKVTEATIEFLDVPGHSLEDSKGRDEWRRILPGVRQADGLVVVVRDFENPAAAMYRNRIDAKADFDELRAELLFADLESVVTRIEKIEKSLKKPSATHDAEKKELALLIKCREALEADRPLSTVVHSAEDRHQVSSFAFLTEKPLVCVRNVNDDHAATAQPLQAEHVAASIALCASIEVEIASLEPADRDTFMKELGLTASARDRLIQSCYAAIGLISFLTMGPDEVRAWTIHKGNTATEAAGKIHTDLARGFVRAETVAYDDLVAHADMKGARAAGKVRKEGKAYVVVDGDILNILANA
ncbi:MAG: redox-regulated ATPase YchF [Planctomycetes bacterium]|nr:redox-regulated ATPase YchF [Planctomycetota bacterium]MBI3835759.1 redox-regulated ATPase YchF [Planctomycetota bacterium]